MQSAGLHPLEDGAGLAEGGVGRGGRVDGPMHGDEVVGSDELVKLEKMDMAAFAALGGVEH